MPVLKVVVQIEAVIQNHLFVGLQQAKGQICNRLVRSERVVELADVHSQILERRLAKDGAVVAEVGGLPAVQVDLGVVGLSPARQLGPELHQLPVGAVGELGAVERLEPHGGVWTRVRANRPRLVVDASLVVVLNPLGHVVELVPWRKNRAECQIWNCRAVS